MFRFLTIWRFAVAALLLVPCLVKAEIPIGPLPRDVMPLHYDVSLNIQPEQPRFSGEVQIQIDIKKACSFFWIHGQNLTVRSSTIQTADGKSIPVKWTQVDPEGVVKIVAPRTLEPQKATLQVSYDAPFDDQLEGLYRVKESSEWYAFTQFETDYARRCFPSFDEPSFRAPFQFTLTIGEKNEAISNTMPAEVKVLKNGLKQIRFEETASLPTYLLAILVGPFDIVKAPDIPASPMRRKPIPLRGVAVHGKGPKLKYALAHIPEFFQRLEDYFGIAYPFPKLDVIAVPDCDYGAMENAGAITFDEYSLLLDEKNAPVAQVRELALSLSHELSHQWFGDLVTIRWWNDIWLNESFATWMESKIVDGWNPAYRTRLSEFEYTTVAMRTDSLEAAHALRQPVDRANDAESLFDSISYAKGGAVLSMFERYLGKDRFQRGIRHFLEKRRFSSATAEDFLGDLSESSDPETRSAFETFLFQSGVPYVDVTLSCQGAKNTVTLQQSRYAPLGSNADLHRLWQVPMCLHYENDQVREQCVLLKQQKSTLSLEGKGCPSWILPNADGAGYFRWNLPAQYYTKLQRPNLPLSLSEQLAIADAIQASFAAGRISAAQAYDGLSHFATSNERAIAGIPMSVLRFTLNSLLPPEMAPALRAYATKLYKPVYTKLGFDSRPGDDDNVRLLRADVVNFLAFIARDPDVRQKAKEHATALLGANGKLDPKAVDPDLVSTVLGVALEEKGAPYFEQLAGLLKTTTDSSQRDELLSALSESTDPALSPKILALSLDPRLRTDEADLPIFYQMAHPQTREVAWKWLRTNFDRFADRVSVSQMSGLPLVARRFCDPAKAEEAKVFFKQHLNRIPGGASSLDEALESVHICATRVSRQSADARHFFAQYSSH